MKRLDVRDGGWGVTCAEAFLDMQGKCLEKHSPTGSWGKIRLFGIFDSLPVTVKNRINVTHCVTN